MPVMLRSRDEAPVEACPACSLRYTPALRVQATAGLSHLRGAAGDVITLVAHGLWPLLGESHGHHEQVSATLGGHDAIPRHPGSTAVSRRPDGGWRLDLSVPPTTAGTHELRVSVDRMGHDIDEVRGAPPSPPTHLLRRAALTLRAPRATRPTAQSSLCRRRTASTARAR